MTKFDKFKMLSLRHLALDAHIGTGVKYNGNDMAIEDVIFETDQLRDKLEKEIEDLQEDFKFTQKVKNAARQNFSNKFWGLVGKISNELFDDFSYSDVTTTDGEVEWKEYFHCVYEAVIPDDTQTYNHCIWDTLPHPPSDLDNTHRGWAIIRDIKNKFEQLKVEGGKVDTLVDILKYQTQVGKEVLKLKKEIIEKSKIREVYHRIIDWSMH